MPRAATPSSPAVRKHAVSRRSSPSKRLTPATASSNPKSTVLNHTVPRAYACYLLRSFGKRTATYIGSTPDPPRRIKQHNGLIVGGAFKTKMGRPWEKELIVYGFPSKLQALQFEWAWQNPHASRHLHAAQIAPAPQGETVSSSTAAVPTPKSSAQFPKTALSNRPQSKVQVLQFMLTSKPWSAFDLRVLLFSCDAQAWWDAARHRLGPVIRTEAALKKWEKSSAEGEGPWTAEQAKRLDRVRVELREEGVDGERLVREERAIEGIGKIQIEDDALAQSQWASFLNLTTTDNGDPAPPLACHLCSLPIDAYDHLAYVICTAASDPHLPCRGAHHLSCLASHFLLSSPGPTPSSSSTPLQALATRSLLPTHGHCPSCDAELTWQDLVRGAYRRDERAKMEAAGGKVKKKRVAAGDEGSATPKRAVRRAVAEKDKGKAKRKHFVPSDEEEEGTLGADFFDALASDSAEEKEADELEATLGGIVHDEDASEADRSFARSAEADMDADGLIISADSDGVDGVISAAEDEDEDEDGGLGFYAPTQEIAAPRRRKAVSTPSKRQSAVTKTTKTSLGRKRGRPKKTVASTADEHDGSGDAKKARERQGRLGMSSTKAALSSDTMSAGTATTATSKGSQKRVKPVSIEYIEISD